MEYIVVAYLDGAGIRTGERDADRLLTIDLLRCST